MQTKKKIVKFLTVAAVAALAVPAAKANVSLKNGNFFMGYTDIIYPGGFEPKIERVYNQKTSFKGMFGWGWGNEYEVYLTVAADGSVVVHEYGGGAENVFTPKSFSENELSAAVGQIVDAARKAGIIGSSVQLKAYQRKLTDDAMFRNDEWEKFRAQGRVRPRVLANGMQLHSNRFSYQYLTKVSGGYVRTFDNGRIEKFSDQGHLTRVSDKNGNFIELTYDRNGHLQRLADNFNRKMFFTFNEKGLLARIDGEGGKKSDYRYNNRDELVYSHDVDGNTYIYAYDTGVPPRHNMAEIGYPAEKTTLKIEYYGRDQHENVKSIKDRDGTLTEYAYRTDPSDRGHYTVSVRVKSSDGKAVSNSSYEYYFKHKADGEEWTYKMTTTLDGDRTETTYNECCGLPLLIKHGAEETSFAYDVKGHVTKKVTPTDVTELTYDPRAGKVAKVVRYSKLNKKQTSWSQFQYDGRANLVFAKNSEGKGVRLFYDGHGRIASMVDQNRRQISFKYNENSKPVQITDPQLGSITVSYTNSGEIKKVESSAGRRIAIQVTSAFQNLLDIIRPAGVSLSF